MDNEVADLIRNHPKDDIWPYLYLRSCHALQESVTYEEAEAGLGKPALDILLVSGFIRAADGKIHLQREDGTWLYQPAAPPKRRAVGPSNFDKQLDRIAKLAGYPTDMVKNRGFYRKRFKVLLEKHGFDRIETIAYDNQGIGLREFLVPGIFKSLEAKWEAEALD